MRSACGRECRKPRDRSFADSATHYANIHCGTVTATEGANNRTVTRVQNGGPQPHFMRAGWPSVATRERDHASDLKNHNFRALSDPESVVAPHNIEMFALGPGLWARHGTHSGRLRRIASPHQPAPGFRCAFGQPDINPLARGARGRARYVRSPGPSPCGTTGCRLRGRPALLGEQEVPP
jgi:hypothetical protein